ncbi:MAG: orotidine-5'-phosphate decarboxylase [Planctomycetes bacterium]|nr:orotidine-5'-phosphate decarboxylase [Planctomycetota bacterium]
MTAPFHERLARAVERKRSVVVVGIDPRLSSFPPAFRPRSPAGGVAPAAAARSIRRFQRALIDLIAPYAVAVKPQIAFYEQYGLPGLAVFADALAYARKRGLVTIADVKRGDVPSTAEAYAAAFLGDGRQRQPAAFETDSITVNPYFGSDGLAPFVRAAVAGGKGCFVLVKTSNPGGSDVQDLRADPPGGKPDTRSRLPRETRRYLERAEVLQGLPVSPARSRRPKGAEAERTVPLESAQWVHEHVADLVHRLNRPHVGKDGYGPIGAVVGATFPAQAAALRRRLPNAWFLVPGVGAQGGSAEDVRGCFDRGGRGALIAASRSIAGAHLSPPWNEQDPSRVWARAVEAAASSLRDELNRVRRVP